MRRRMRLRGPRQIVEHAPWGPVILALEPEQESVVENAVLVREDLHWPEHGRAPAPSEAYCNAVQP